MKTQGGKLLTTQSVYITKVDDLNQERQTLGMRNDRAMIGCKKKSQKKPPQFLARVVGFIRG